MAIIRIYTGDDSKSHFQDLEPVLAPREGGMPGDKEATVHAEGGIVLRSFDPGRSNAWHGAPGKVCVFNMSGEVEIEVGDGSKRRLGPGDILIAEDVDGQGHYTREVGDETRVSLFVPFESNPD